MLCTLYSKKSSRIGVPASSSLVCYCEIYCLTSFLHKGILLYRKLVRQYIGLQMVGCHTDGLYQRIVALHVLNIERETDMKQDRSCAAVWG